MSTLHALSGSSDRLLAHDVSLSGGTEVGGRYRIERVLALGGMATIYIAHDLRLQRAVALKLLSLRSGRTADLSERFFREARALARLRSRHVTRVLDYGRLQEFSTPVTPYIVMELLEGVDLRSEVQSRTRLSAAVAAGYLSEACEGLAEAHAQGIVHRDIKPDNLFLAREPDGTTTIKLLDFGISKSAGGVSGPVTRVNECVGTPRYMSPEQMTAMPADARSDIWALGAVLFECVTGEPAFGGSTVFEIGAQVLGTSAANLRQRHPELADALVSIVERCLQRKPEHRFQTVAELAQALEPLATQSNASSAERIACTLGTSRTVLPLASSSPNCVREIRLKGDRTFERTGGSRRYKGPRTLALLAIAVSIGYLALRPPEKLFDLIVDARHGTKVFYDVLLR